MKIGLMGEVPIMTQDSDIILYKRTFDHPILHFQVTEIIDDPKSPDIKAGLVERRICWYREPLDSLVVDSVPNPIFSQKYTQEQPQLGTIQLLEATRNVVVEFDRYWLDPKNSPFYKKYKEQV